MSPDIVTLLVALAVGAMLILVGVEALHFLRSRAIKPSNPNQQAVLDAISQWIYTAIIAGEKTVKGVETTVDADLQGMDKKAVADSVYALLPDSILVGGIPIPLSVIKSFVPKDVFEARIKDAYDAVHAFILRNQAWLDSQVGAIVPPTLTDGTGTSSVTKTITFASPTDATPDPIAPAPAPSEGSVG